VSCAKTVTLIEMPFRMWTEVGPNEPCIRWRCRCPRGRGNFDGKKGQAWTCSGSQYTESHSTEGSTSTVQMLIGGVLDGMLIDATWRTWWNHPCVAAMLPYVRLLWPLVIHLHITK